jgi:hypothetical protein
MHHNLACRRNIIHRAARAPHLQVDGSELRVCRDGGGERERVRIAQALREEVHLGAALLERKLPQLVLAALAGVPVRTSGALGALRHRVKLRILAHTALLSRRHSRIRALRAVL